jgi:hypothetical protein
MSHPIVKFKHLYRAIKSENLEGHVCYISYLDKLKWNINTSQSAQFANSRNTFEIDYE